MIETRVFAPAFIDTFAGDQLGWKVICRTPDDDAWRVYLPGPISEEVARTTAAALNDHAAQTVGTGDV